MRYAFDVYLFYTKDGEEQGEDCKITGYIVKVRGAWNEIYN